MAAMTGHARNWQTAGNVSQRWLCKACGGLTYHDPHCRFCAPNGSQRWFVAGSAPLPLLPVGHLRAGAVWATWSAVDGRASLPAARPSPSRAWTPSPPRPRRSRYGAARNAGHQRENLVISGDPSPAQIPSLLPALWIASHKQICNHVIQKPRETRKQHRVRAPDPPTASCISGRVFLLSLYMCGCMCALRASVYVCVCVSVAVGVVCVHRVFMYCCVQGGWRSWNVLYLPAAIHTLVE